MSFYANIDCYAPGRMLLMTAKKAFPSLQLGPKSVTWTPSCLLTCSQSYECQAQLPWPHLGLHPLQQGLLGADLPPLLGLPAHAAFAYRAVVISAAGVAPALDGGAALTKLLQYPRVLFNLRTETVSN